MREPLIHYEDPNLEYNIWDTNYLQYKGALFTGTLLYDDTKPDSYTEYKNGNYDGNSISYHKNGKIAENSIYKDGNYVSGKEWYENEQLRYNSEDGDIILDEDGILTSKNGVWFCKNENIRLIREKKVTKIYSEKGCLAILIEPNSIDSNNYPTFKTTYYHNVLKESYKNLYDHIYLHPEDNINFRHSLSELLNAWVIKLYRDDYRKESLLILNQMIKNSENILRENPHFLIESLETNFIHNSKILLKRITGGEFDYNNGMSTIIF